MDSLSQNYYKNILDRENNQNFVTIFNKKRNKICKVEANSVKVYRIWTSRNKFNFKSNINKICNSLTKTDDKMQLWHRRMAQFYIEKLKNKLKDIEIKDSY